MHGVFSARQLGMHGLSRSAIEMHLRTRRLRRLRRGWYATEDADPSVAAAAAAGGRLSCVSALAHLGAWTMPHRDLHLRAAAGTSAVAAPGRRIHWTRERLGDDAVIDDVATSLRIAVGCLDLRAAVVVVDSALNRGLVAPDSLVHALASTPRGRHILRLCDGRAESGIETLARLALRSRNLRVTPQVLVAGIGRVDLLIGDRLVFETDGKEWHADFERDRARDRALVARGYLVIRASCRQVMGDWATIEHQIHAIVARRDHLWRRSLTQGLRHPPGAGASRS